MFVCLDLFLLDLSHLENLAVSLDISDSSITASSEWGTYHEAERVRLNRYFGLACAWAAGGNDRAPWVQFDMEQDVTVWGVVMKPRCDADQRVTFFQVSSSEDGTRWCDVSERITPDYSVDRTSTSWFDEPVTARYWRIKVLAFLNHPSMKADLIGEVYTGKKKTGTDEVFLPAFEQTFSTLALIW